MKTTRKKWMSWGAVVAIAAAGLLAGRCAPSAPKGAKKGPANASDQSVGAMKTYVAPGDLDEYYMFASGGHSGQVYVYGIPSMRHLSTIPVYAPYPAVGYGFDDESKAMLGGLTWGDVHHPALSETNGDYDGRWLFVNEMNGRVARIDLKDFKTKQIFGPMPNISGNHGSAFVTPNTEYSMMASRFSIPIPKGRSVPIDKYATEYKGVIAAVKIDPKTGAMSQGFQILTPPFDWDLGRRRQEGLRRLDVLDLLQRRARDGQARGHGLAARPRLHRGRRLAGRREGDRRGQGRRDRRREGPRPEEGAGIVWLLPCGKSPHGVDVSPDGKYIVGSGKLQGVTTVFNFEKSPDGDPQQGLHGRRGRDSRPEVRVHQGRRGPGGPRAAPHAVRAGRHVAYTSLFVDSAIAKWKLGTWEVVDKVPMSYSIGHLAAAEGDTCSPKGKYLVGLNKLSHGRHLSVGPSQPESSQLVDISEEKMKIIYDAFTEPEPHYAQIVAAKTLHPIEVYPKEENKHPLAIWDVKDAGVTRQGSNVTAKVVLVRSTITPAAIEVNQGDTVKIAMTNIEQTTDELHGFGLLDYNINIVVDPGETKVVTFKADKPGVFPYYCTNFCSALHQEMQGYLIVKGKS